MADNIRELSLETRFEFGKNWRRFLRVLSEDHIHEAEKSLKIMLGMDKLNGKRFLDVGSGSGLFSLAARRLGATVYSFDYDDQSVECTKSLKQKYFPNDVNWTVSPGSILDRDFVQSLGTFDIIYAWGVLHHTGAMWQALEEVDQPLAEGGKLFIAIYNKQRIMSRFWLQIKRLYCSGWIGKILTIGFYFPYAFLVGLTADLIRMKNPEKRYSEYKKSRGMSKWIDWLDWLGGYPYEVATPQEIFDFYKMKDFQLHGLKTNCGLACNEYVFIKHNTKK